MKQALTADNKLVGLDFVRSAGCCTVVLHHLAQHMAKRTNFGWLEPLRGFVFSGAFGVAIFFVLSGFLLSRPFWMGLDAGQALPSLRVYALRRAARILPGFWLALTVSFICSFTLLAAPLDSRLVLRYVAGFFLISDMHWLTLFPVEFNPPLWSIAFEVSSYALLPVGALALFMARPRVGTGWPLRFVWCAVIAAAMFVHWLLCATIQVDQHESGWEFGLLGGAKTWMPYFNPLSLFTIFAVGALAGGVQVQWSRHRSWIFDVLAVIGMATATWLFLNLSFTRRVDGMAFLRIPYGFPSFPLAVAAVLALLPQTLIVGRVLDNRVVRYLATISFGIYAWHCLVLELLSAHAFTPLPNGRFADPLEFALFAASVVAVTLGIAHTSYRFLERPLMAWARGLEASFSTNRRGLNKQWNEGLSASSSAAADGTRRENLVRGGSN